MVVATTMTKTGNGHDDDEYDSSSGDKQQLPAMTKAV